MTDIVLNPIANPSNTSLINDNFDKIETVVNEGLLHLEGGNNVMKQNIDMNSRSLLNVHTDVNLPNSLLTVTDGDARYYNVSGDTLTGPMNVGGNTVSGLPAAVGATEPVRKQEFDAAIFDSAAQLRSDLADPEGSSLVGHQRSVLTTAITTANQMLDAQFVSIWEKAGLITDKPSDDYKTWDFAPAMQAAFDTGLPVVFGFGEFTWKSPVTYTNKNSFFGYGMVNTILKYRGPTDTWGLTHAFTGDGSDQWPGRVCISDLTIQGDGTGNLGVGATVSGLRVADNNAALVNIPWYALTRVKLDRLKYGIQLEGYAHALTDCWAEKCLIGFDITHPEQASMINCWANYCDIGLDINNRKLKSGHFFNISGGAYQRCRIGIRAKNFDELNIDTYFELNTEADLQCGDPADPTNYTKGIKNLKVRCHSASNPSTANIDMYATNGSVIDYNGYGGSNTTVPHVQTNGYCKQTVVEYNPEGITSTVPFVFNGDSVLSAIAKVRGGSDRVRLPSMGTAYTSVSTNPIGYFLLNNKEIRIRGAFSVTTGYSGSVFTLPLGYRPKYVSNFTCAMFSGSWSFTTVQIATNGAFTWNQPGDNRTVYLDITLERDDGFY